MISALRGRRPKPLDERARIKLNSKYNYTLQINKMAIFNSLFYKTLIAAEAAVDYIELIDEKYRLPTS